MIQAGGYVTDGREALTDDRYDPPSIEVEDKDDNRSWQADAAFAAQSGSEGRSQVDDFEMDGPTPRAPRRSSTTTRTRWMEQGLELDDAVDAAARVLLAV